MEPAPPTPPPHDVAPDAAASPTHTRWRRLNALVAVVPLGVVVCAHLALAARAAYGPAVFDAGYAAVVRLPGGAYVAALLLGVPLLVHVAYGLVVASARGGRADVRRDPRLGTWAQLIGQVSGVVALGFVAVHAWRYHLPALLGRADLGAHYDRVSADLNVPWRYALYATGVTATAFHFANGLHRAGRVWGLATSPRAARRAAWACGVAGVLFWALAMNTLWHFAFRCGGVLPLPGLDATRVCGAALRP